MILSSYVNKVSIHFIYKNFSWSSSKLQVEKIEDEGILSYDLSKTKGGVGTGRVLIGSLVGGGWGCICVCVSVRRNLRGRDVRSSGRTKKDTTMNNVT